MLSVNRDCPSVGRRRRDKDESLSDFLDEEALFKFRSSNGMEKTVRLKRTY